MTAATIDTTLTQKPHLPSLPSSTITLTRCRCCAGWYASATLPDLGRPTGFTSFCGSWSRARNFFHRWPATVEQPNSKPYAHFPQANPLVLTTLHGTERVKLSSRASGISAHPISSHPVNMSQCLISSTPAATRPATTRTRTADIALSWSSAWM